jgi:hypothetical protein
VKVIVTTTDPGGVTRILVDEPPKGHEGVIALSSPKPGSKP